MKARGRERVITDSRWTDKDHLFYYPPCDVPAWDSLIDEMIELVEEYNSDKNNMPLRFFQIKEKFGQLVVYLEVVPNDSTYDNVPRHMEDMINRIANEGHKICRICHERKVETVIESRLQWRCLDHWKDRRA
jgi:hypothetical protein